ncbi:uncharacterized protein Z518_06332 [Rhinocladiella mackenziei CBS 650.93]|uniref:Rhinocladiella mackenziei CBS 650.93 unplaced genomic scaffold supercont1.4, whole genome shotgun sequence n=1 Tax=Rhinocladiella mackenziei CBS 650.93 TaxID=1442369 RepID=A0A0D2J8N0_9EURO|nr:uncharacterized protein Z518_06332 [Rhinocladiella mackenziei CBS 650.93]KIX05460.1 hypothetical protein Z518_06332 [Rhinocladiella mackenziei CBS 650.93]
MTLDMSSFAGVQKFANALKAQFTSIDEAILNAGTMQAKYVASSDGWEETLQVNALSTFLLGILVLPLLIASADAGTGSYTPHLTTFMASETPLEDLSTQKHSPPGTFGGSTQYSRSKLVLEYAVRHLAASPALKGADGQPKVIVNTPCPGFCKSGLRRQMSANAVVKFIGWLLYAIFARTAEQGTNSYTPALPGGVETHGEMWKNDRVYEPGPMYATEEGRKFGDRVWSEVSQVILKADPSTEAFIG